MCHFPEDHEGFESSITTAAEEAKEHCSPSQVYLVYKCIDMSDYRVWSNSFNVDRYFWYQEPKDLNIIEIQPVCIEDKNVVSRILGHGKISGDLQHQPFSFVPQPQFKFPNDNNSLEKNVRLYLLYRTGEEKGLTMYLRKFGPFKGYSVVQKKMVAEKLLAAIEDPDIFFTNEELKILKNGILGKATQGVALERLIKRTTHYTKTNN